MKNAPTPSGERPTNPELDRNGLAVITAAQLKAYLDGRREELPPAMAVYGEQLGSRLESESTCLSSTVHAYLVPHIGARAEEYTRTVGRLSSDCYHGVTVSGDPVPSELLGLSDGEYVDMAREALSTWPREMVGAEFAQRIETLIDLES